MKIEWEQCSAKSGTKTLPSFGGRHQMSWANVPSSLVKLWPAGKYSTSIHLVLLLSNAGLGQDTCDANELIVKLRIFSSGNGMLWAQAEWKVQPSMQIYSKGEIPTFFTTVEILRRFPNNSVIFYGRSLQRTWLPQSLNSAFQFSLFFWNDPN